MEPYEKMVEGKNPGEFHLRNIVMRLKRRKKEPKDNHRNKIIQRTPDYPF